MNSKNDYRPPSLKKKPFSHHWKKLSIEYTHSKDIPGNKNPNYRWTNAWIFAIEFNFLDELNLKSERNVPFEIKVTALIWINSTNLLNVWRQKKLLKNLISVLIHKKLKMKTLKLRKFQIFNSIFSFCSQSTTQHLDRVQEENNALYEKLVSILSINIFTFPTDQCMRSFNEFNWEILLILL